MTQPAPQSEEQELERLLEEFRTTAKKMKGIHKVGAVQKFRIAKYKKAVPAILEAMAGEDDMTRASLAGVVLLIDPAQAQAFAILLECLKSKDDDARVTAVIDLCKTEVAIEKKWEVFKRTMRDPCPMARVHTLGGLLDIVKTSQILRQEAFQLIVDSVKDRDMGVREDAVSSLGEISAFAKPAIPTLAGILKDPSPGMRERAARSLGKFGKDAASAASALGKALSDPDEQVRYAVACTLYLMGQPAKAAIKDMAQSLSRPESHRGARFHVIWTLGNLGSDSAVALPALERIAKSATEDPEVRRDAAEAIKKITGK